ncbi:MAG: hypothetical protein LBK50_00965 [Candidatus Nomurabacteria bacterium]|jgi:hypothetical protein|nr:hypothetical protein [Candidatus Nomurabacteria bacterium]
MAKYTFFQFDPRPAGEATNVAAVEMAKGGVLGIEVTVPALTELCTLGNLDHHGVNAGKPAAIEQALTYPLPPVKIENASVLMVTLATVRADLDSVGAMAIMSLRNEWSYKDSYDRNRIWASIENPFVLLELYDRVKKVAAADTAALAAASEWRPGELPTRENPWPTAMAIDGRQDLAAIASAVADFRVPLEERVEAMKTWLLTGEEPAGYREKVEAERLDMIAALEDGSIDYAEASGVARVVSTHRAATTVGYSLAPVVVALNPEFRVGGGEPHAKFTVCQFKPGYIDLAAVFAELSKKEPGWGGTATIGGSPQGVSSELTIYQVVEVVRRHLI